MLYIPRFSDNLFDNDDDDVELGDWKPPDSELVQKMVSQIEYYLSDENLVKDAFLLKHVKRNKLGYVNIKLLTSFKKVRSTGFSWNSINFFQWCGKAIKSYNLYWHLYLFR